MDFWYKFGRLLAQLMMRNFGRIELVGLENVPPIGPLIITPNHQSNADPALLAQAFKRPLWFMGKRDLFRHFITRYFMTGFHVHPVERDKRDIDAVRWCLDTLNKDRALVIFPEGTRHPLGLGKATDGAVYLALKSQAPLIPVAITGTGTMRSMLRIAFPFRKLRVVIGSPYTLPDVEGRVPKSVLESLSRDLMLRIAAILPPQYRGNYGDFYLGSSSDGLRDTNLPS
jgi:1-acyl-sn-glycerol-3-phosphate acyltransferase